MTTDPFRHLPQLRNQLTPAERSELRLTRERLAQWDERAQKMGSPANWRRSIEELESARRALLDQLDLGDGLWVYSYGSLMWDPGFHFAEVRLAELAGHQRRFSYMTKLARGSPACPGLMLSLDECAGSCKGLAFRIANDLVHAESAMVWGRELIRGGYRAKLLPVGTPQGPITALVFCSNPSHPDFVDGLTIEETAAMIASASGFLGTNRQYLEQVAAQLERLGIADAYIGQLVQQVRRICAP
jgi:cation transport protein ChaC